MKTLQFIFTEDSFYPDIQQGKASSSDRRIWEAFDKDRYGTLFHMGLKEKEEGISPSAAF